jgi:hypothetical protein
MDSEPEKRQRYVVIISQSAQATVICLGRVSGALTAHLRRQIRHVRTLTDKPFGVNIILATLQAERRPRPRQRPTSTGSSPRGWRPGGT